MRRAVGFSTGAIDRADCRAALELLRPRKVPAVELYVPTGGDLKPLLQALGSLDLSGYSHISLHAPSEFDALAEKEVVDLLGSSVPNHWPIIVHPDVFGDDALWQGFGGQICIENMGKRKALGRTAAELQIVFARFPRASFCFDIGHARQVDPTMSEAALMLQQFRARVRQVHMSEVTSLSHHEGISFTALNAFRKVAHLIPAGVPIILETPVPADQLEIQLHLAEKALLVSDDRGTPAAQNLNGVTKPDRLPTTRDLTAGELVRP